MQALIDLFDAIHAGLFEALVQPLLFRLGLMGYAEDAFNAVEVALYGVIEIGALYVLLRPLEAWRPVESWADRRALRVDVLYTVLHRVGFLPLLLFLAVSPLVDAVNAALRLRGLMPFDLESLIPGLDQAPLLAFGVYVVVLDLGEYWRHRLQHRFNWWWALHSLHHSQRQLSFWADNRNHLLDDVLADLWLAALAALIGVPTGQFVLILIAMRMVESLSHANVRLSWGSLGGRLLVSPRFHRRHHGIGVGHEGGARGCNFAPLLPVWDIVFGTANFDDEYPATGVRDQLGGADYGDGFIRQQVLGIKRLIACLAPRRARTKNA